MAVNHRDVARVVLSEGARSDLGIVRGLLKSLGKTPANDSDLWRVALSRGRRAVERDHAGVRLRRARIGAKLGQTGLARLLGYWHRSSVGNVEIGRAPLAGALLAWVQQQEAASR